MVINLMKRTVWKVTIKPPRFTIGLHSLVWVPCRPRLTPAINRFTARASSSHDASKISQCYSPYRSILLTTPPVGHSPRWALLHLNTVTANDAIELLSSRRPRLVSVTPCRGSLQSGPRQLQVLELLSPAWKKVRPPTDLCPNWTEVNEFTHAMHVTRWRVAPCLHAHDHQFSVLCRAEISNQQWMWLISRLPTPLQVYTSR